MIRVVTTAEEFNEACTEYFKYHHNRWNVADSEYEDDSLIVGISFKITTSEQFNDPEVRKLFGSNVCILDDSLGLLGKVCTEKYSTEPENVGVYIGIEATEEDFYYMLQRNDGTVFYETCVGNIVEVKED